MSYMKLIKLLYFADRKALLQLGRPITYDQWVSMPHGPVLSRTYDLVAAEPDPSDPTYWHRYISRYDRYEVQLIEEAPNGELAPAEEAILKEVFEEWGNKTRWDVRDASHNFPEYRRTSSSVRISYREVLLLEGHTEAEADEIEGDLEAEEFLTSVAGNTAENQSVAAA
ncbi:MAG: Panacea domain-containing protein [Gemmatimonadota bacterium]|nr:Panacea domain-containing protein [Gemmatimonadota bacterium]